MKPPLGEISSGNTVLTTQRPRPGDSWCFTEEGPRRVRQLRVGHDRVRTACGAFVRTPSLLALGSLLAPPPSISGLGLHGSVFLDRPF